MDYLNYENGFFRAYPMMTGVPPMMDPNMLSMNMNQMQNMNVNQDVTFWPLDFMNKSTQYLVSDLANGLKDAVMDEKHDELFYDQMIKIAPESDKKIIEGIRNNEMLHNKIFRKAYLMLMGVPLPTNIDESVKADFNNMSYMNMLKTALMGELKAVEEYRKLLAYAPNKTIANMIMYPLTDEIRHANLYNYLICMNTHKT